MFSVCVMLTIIEWVDRLSLNACEIAIFAAHYEKIVKV